MSVSGKADHVGCINKHIAGFARDISRHFWMKRPKDRVHYTKTLRTNLQFLRISDIERQPVYPMAAFNPPTIW